MSVRIAITNRGFGTYSSYVTSSSAGNHSIVMNKYFYFDLLGVVIFIKEEEKNKRINYV